MSAKKRIFISSVQKELELERAAVAGLITSDPFLLQHCEPVLYEKEPPPPRPAPRAYLDCLRSCSLYVLIVANEYGRPDGEVSATHHEYRLAQELKLPTIVFIKGAGDADRVRTPEVQAFIAEIKAHGFKYQRFHDREDLKPEMLRALAHALEVSFGIRASAAEITEGEHLIDTASSFEATVLSDVSVELLDQDLLNDFNHRTSSNEVEQLWRSAGQALHSRGLAVRGPAPDSFWVTAGAYVLFAPRPANRFPQCEILLDAYDDVRLHGRPKGQASLNAPLPEALAQALKFIDDHTFHPRRVVGLNNLRLDEYPVPALREALVNAVAHRSYDDTARKVFVRLFSDRIEIASPGYPPQPLTLAKLRRGDYRPCSRNPLLAQTLATLALMEQRGSGFARMRDAMLDHGLDEPRLAQQDGFFTVTLPGPAGNYGRLRAPVSATGPITPALEARLNERQKKILQEVQTTGAVTSGWCRDNLSVTYDTANRDLLALVELGLLRRTGKGRSTKYELQPSAS